VNWTLPSPERAAYDIFHAANCSDLPSCRAVVVANSVAEGKWRKKWCPHLLLLVGQSLDGPKKNFLLDLFSFFTFFYLRTDTSSLSCRANDHFQLSAAGPSENIPPRSKSEIKAITNSQGPLCRSVKIMRPNRKGSKSLQTTLHISVMGKQIAFCVDKLK
jgi:hypothetical protein